MKHIVFVDDEPDFHVITKVYFSKEIKSGEFKLAFFSKPLEALEYLLSNSDSVQILFTDLKMGKLDGFELIQSIRGKSPNLPCYIISALPDESYKKVAEELNIISFLEKPINYKNIREIISNI